MAKLYDTKEIDDHIAMLNSQVACSYCHKFIAKRDGYIYLLKTIRREIVDLQKEVERLQNLLNKGGKP